MTIQSPPPPLDDPLILDPLSCPPLRWGILGCGRISHDFVQALKLLPTASVTAVAAKDIQKAQEFAVKHNILTFCKCYYG
jgi:predicted dehydrogenase